MSDLYHIPNDDGKTYRLKKFVEYQHEAPQTHIPFLQETLKGKSKDDIVDAAFVFCTCYNEITTPILLDLLKKLSPNEIWAKHKKQLIFNSAAQKTKNMNMWVQLMNNWYLKTKKKPFEWLIYVTKNKADKYETLFKAVKEIKGIGRFKADLFMEIIVAMQQQLNIQFKEPARIDWKDCSNLTSGIYNIFYEDEKASEYERTHNIEKSEQEKLTSRLKIIKSEIQKTYPEQDARVPIFIGKICSFRNLFKGKRYAGFHHDRQLETIRSYEAFCSQDRIEQFYTIRRKIYPQRFLGELNGWNGIRKERELLWLKYGKTGAEHNEK